MNLQDVCDILNRLSPASLAEDWDNTGLLLAARSRGLDHVLLCIDLRAAVLDEAIRVKAQLVIAYHPVIFDPIKRLDRRDPRSHLLLRALEAGISVYSPHTALDAVPGGVSDWLCQGFPQGEVRPLATEGAPGPGRVIRLKRPAALHTLACRFQAHLAAPYLRIAKAGTTRAVRTVALCPGAGASVLRGVKADLVVTGELRHHDILGFTEGGTHVLLSEHSHTERPYLRHYRDTLLRQPDWEARVTLSRSDREPLHLFTQRGPT